jgi:hypothetical protein
MKSWTTECEREATSEPTANMAAPAKNIRRRPMMSPSRPKLISSEANTSEYPEMTHCNEETLLWNSRTIVGTATLRIVLSNTMMNSALDSTTSAIHRFGSDCSDPDAADVPVGDASVMGLTVLKLDYPQTL